MQTQESTREEQMALNPFRIIPLPVNHRVKVWDFNLNCENWATHMELTTGRVRILAVVPKKPEPLENIKFSVAWCSPSDMKHFSKSKSNKILIGRYLSCFVDGRPNDSCGVVLKTDSLRYFQIDAFNALKLIPRWTWNAVEIIQRTSVIPVVMNDENLFQALNPLTNDIIT